MTDLARIARTAAVAAHAAGEVLQGYRGRFEVEEKGPQDLVTDADHAAQDAVVKAITDAFPDHDLYGEEGLREERGGEYRWTIDPLDGTGNYVHGFPFYAVSIGVERLSDAGAAPAVGAIYDPSREEMFLALLPPDGEAEATVNGRPMRTSPCTDLPRAFLMSSIPRNSPANAPEVRRFTHMLNRCETVQRSGSAALNLAYVACGRVDGYWSTSLKPWDQAAGAVLVEAAGGTMRTIDGGPFRIADPDMLACSNAALAEATVAELARA
ncbi:inositol monophosphatase family protein [Alienimonas californiensis]|uniref:Inositol-1-monophosphatase n=1 Tax=Alienimonas californiensis TaxID=2527989 RepID=A0A517PD61_9PLAN|nr:inositol monophosphatase family protein [Alienimonas californiensis]QDT17317.1 Inositol-1-monophosphatase [Alienimonas californiensis]